MDNLSRKNLKMKTNTDDLSPGASKKRRKRVSLTCTSCKHRKVKCDQGKPCASCVKKRIPAHLCIYEDSPFIPSSLDSTNPTEAIILLKDENVKLKAEIEELRKWKEIVSGDPMPNPLNKKVRLFENVSLKANRVTYFGPTSWRTLLDKEGSYGELVKSAKNYVSSVKKEWKIEKNLSDIPYEEYKEVNVDSPQKLLANLSKYLPDYDTLRKSIQKFIEGYWNQRLPIIDPNQLMTDFDNIIIKEGHTFTFRIVNKTIDYAKISLIVVVLKYVISTNNSFQKEVYYDLRDHLLRYTERLLEYSKDTVKGSLPALQTLILLKQFRMINPIDGDGGDSSEGSLGFKTAINMAILMGLNKNINQLYKNTPLYTKNVLKNIWKHLMYQDAVLSFHLGIPLSIDDQYIDQQYFRQETLFGSLTIFLRDAVKALTKSESCTQQEIVSIIEKMESYNNGELLELSLAVKELSSADVVLRNYSNLLAIEYKLFGIYTLHVLYDVLYHGAENDDPNRTVYYNGTMKYGTLSATHFIEILLRFNKFCVDNQDNKDKLFNIVEMAQSIVGVSKITFIKIFCAICTFEVIRLFEDDLRLTLPKTLHFSMEIRDFELLNPHESLNILNASFKSPAFLHGLMTLACKYMLKMKNESFESVFNLNFCLFVVLALFKYFEKFIDRKLSKEKETSSLDKIQTTVMYDTATCQSTVRFPNAAAQSFQNNENNHSNNLQNPNAVNVTSVYTPNSVTNSISSSVPETGSTPNSTADPSSISTQSYMTGQFANNFTDPIDEMFKDILKDDSLLSLQMDSSINWDINDFLSGTDMFYDHDKHSVINSNNPNNQKQQKYNNNP